MTEKQTFVFSPFHGVLLVVAAAGLLFLWFWPSAKTPIPEPQPVAIAPEPQSVAPEPAPIKEPEPVVEPEPVKPAEVKPEPKPVAVQLPSLDQSDPEVKAKLQEAGDLGLSSVVTNEYIIRKTVRAVVAAANGEWVNQHLPFKTPNKPFAVSGDKENLHIAPANFERYTPYVNALVAVDTNTAVGMYKQYYPLLQEAYEELGLKQGNFHSSLKQALSNLRNAPAYSDEQLVQPSVMYQYKNKTLESSPEIQKLLLRMGPKNKAKLQTWLTEIEQALATVKL